MRPGPNRLDKIALGRTVIRANAMATLDWDSVQDAL
jgi:hypothetical protein